MLPNPAAVAFVDPVDAHSSSGGMVPPPGEPLGLPITPEAVDT